MTIKQALSALSMLAASFALLQPAHASLELRGGNGDMVYDTESNLTWVRDASLSGPMNWAQARAWADSLTFHGRDDWRLPGLSPANGVAFNVLEYSDDGSTDVGYNNSGLNSELGFLYYQSLGNNATDGLMNTGLFQNLDGTAHWTGAASPNAGEAMAFFTLWGNQESIAADTGIFYAWAVRAGDTPEPQSIALVLAALGALALGRRKKSAV